MRNKNSRSLASKKVPFYRGFRILAGLFLSAALLAASNAYACIAYTQTLALTASCGNVGNNIGVTITWNNQGTTHKMRYVIGFGDSTDTNVYWYTSSCAAGKVCSGSPPQINGNAGNCGYTSPTANTNPFTVNQSVAVPLVGYTITNIIVMTMDFGDTNNGYPFCDGSNCTKITTIPFTVPCPPTSTPTPTVCTNGLGRTCTPTPTTGSLATNTFTKTNTPTSIPSNTPTITNTPTVTFTFTPTYTNTPCGYPGPLCTPTAAPCNNPSGATAQNLQGGVWCFQNQQTLLSANSVFGMSLSDVKNVADYIGTSNGTPVTLNIASDWKLAYFDGNLTYDPSYAAPYNRLHGFGVLVVNGDLTLNPGFGSTLPSDYGGVVFVTGNLTINDGCEIDGSVIMGTPYYHVVAGVGVPGNVNLTGSAGNFGTIFYSPSLVTTAQQLVGQYREDISQKKTLLAIPFMQ